MCICFKISKSECTNPFTFYLYYVGFGHCVLRRPIKDELGPTTQVLVSSHVWGCYLGPNSYF